jgi:rifampicin phosphotransferase
MLAELAALDPSDTERWGGKAVGLARLMRAGLPVPEGFALSVRAWRAFIRHNNLRGEPDAMRRGTLAGRLPPALAGQLRVQAARLGDRLVVRSSAVDEDGAERSFAGQYLTVLNVRPGDGLEDAIKACWASLYDPAALAYRRGRPRGMGLVIQRLVDAEVSGVLFTIDPMSGSWRRMVVEAAEGQGEGLVSGRVAPDRYVLERARHPWLTRLQRPREVEVDLGGQQRRLVPGAPGELRWEAVRNPDARKLSAQHVRELARMGLKAERLAGTPMDMEWSLGADGLRLLQARPITAAGEPVRDQEVLWTRRFVGERWAGQASPLGWSITGGLLDWFIAYPETSRRFLGGAAPTRLLQGHPYFNVSVFRHLAFKLPGRPAPDFMMEFLPPDEREVWNRKFAHPPDLRVYRAILGTTFREQRWRRFRWNPRTNPTAWDTFVGRLSLPRPAGLSALERCVELKRQYIKIHITSLLFANIAWQLMQSALGPEVADEVLRVPDNPTVRSNIALWQWGRGQRSDEDFLAEFGHRCTSSSWELFTPRWDEAPPRELAAQLARGTDPTEMLKEQTWKVANALDRLRADQPARMASVRLARRYMALREEQRWTFDRLMHRMKACALAVGGLDEPERIQWLQLNELRELHGGTRSREECMELAERRERQWALDAQRPPPPVFLKGDTGVEVPTDGHRLTGLGISPGRATGTVRVLRGPEEAHRLQPGEVLVALGTDPGWTPLFLRASAVVLELGSMLSHGAVLAREYQLPAVVNVAGATTRLRDGQRVTVDGRRGVVWLQDGPTR